MPTVVVDFTDSEGGGRGIRIPEDDYRAVCKELVQKESKAGNQMLVGQFRIVDGKHKGKELRDWFPLTKEMAWKLRSFLEATGATVPSKKAKVKTEKYLDLEVGITVADEERDNRITSKIQDYIGTDVLDDDDSLVEDEDEDEEPAPKKKGKKGKKGKKKKGSQQAGIDNEESVEELDLDEV
jgi:hypothetical protein